MCGRRNNGDRSGWRPVGLHAGNELDRVPRRLERQLDGASSRHGFLMLGFGRCCSKVHGQQRENTEANMNTGPNSNIGSL